MARGNRKLWTIGAGLLLLVAVVSGVGYLLASTPKPGPAAMDPNPVKQGGQVRISAHGFLPLEPVVIRVAGKADGSDVRVLRQTEATVHGGLDSAYIALPDNLTSGAHALQIWGKVSGRQTTTILYVRANAPWLTLDSTETKPRAKLGLVAGGFDPGERLRVSIEAAAAKTVRPQNLADLATDRVGNTAWTQVRLPLVTPGTYSLVVRGESSGQQLRKTVNVTAYQPSVELSPWAGPPGTNLQLNARGFEAGEKVQVFLGEGSRAGATLTADRYGNLWGAGPVRVPYLAGVLPLTVKLVGQDSTAQTSAQFRVLKPKPWLELTQYWGAPGGSVEFSGGGWAGGERIAFHVGSAMSPTVAYGKADDYGWLHNAGPATIPKDATYQVTFVAVGEDSHSVATATFKIVLPFGISPVGVTPTAGGQAPG